MASKRTRLRNGSRVYLEKVEGFFGRVTYVGRGKHPEHKQDFNTLADATKWFEDIEKGREPAPF